MMISTLIKLLSNSLTWELIAIFLFSIGSIFTVLFSFVPKEKFQQISLRFFMAGTFLWISTILVLSCSIAISEINKIGWFHFIFSILGLFFSLYTGLMWIKKNKYVWFVCTIICISITVFFAL